MRNLRMGGMRVFLSLAVLREEEGEEGFLSLAGLREEGKS
jgi:hypothetical protein